MTVILVELTAIVDAAGTEKKFYLSTGKFVTSPTDVPANTAFLPRLKEPGSISTSAYGSGRTSGGTSLDKGEITVLNADGVLDDWAAFGFDGQRVTIRVGERGGAYPSDFPAVLTGTIAAVEAGFSTLRLRLRDMQHLLAVPACSSIYAGDNVLPDGVEGTEADLKGKRKPVLYGTVFNIAPPCVNTSLLTYQVSDGEVQSIGPVYDQGVELTAGSDFPTIEDLQDEVPGAGTFITCLAEGLFRLGSAAAGQITCDASQGETVADRTTAQILSRLATSAGIVPDVADGDDLLLGEDGEVLLGEDGEPLFGAGYTSGTLTTGDATILDSAAPAETGIWITEDETVASAMDRVAASCGAYYGFDALGRFRMGQLTAPAGTPALVLTNAQVKPGLERQPPRDNALPVWAATVNHTRNHTVQTTELAGGVSSDRRAFLAQTYRSVRKESAMVQTKHALAGELSVDTALVQAADAELEAIRLLALHGEERAIYQVPVAIDVIAGKNLTFMDVVTLDQNRFDLTGGKPFRLIGIGLELGSRSATLSLWG